MAVHRSQIPASFLGIAVGLLAFANAWRLAARLWQLPAGIASALTLSALAVWLVLLAGYARKWLQAPGEARAEAAHPVQSSFLALGPIASLLAAMTLIPYARGVAVAVFALSAVAEIALGAWLQGRLWQGGRAFETVTPALYLPTVGQNFVAATAAAAFGWHTLGVMFFGVAMLSWLALESVIMQRAAVLDALPPALRPTLGVQLAPPVVGGVSWMSLNGGTPDLFALILLGYGVYQAVLLLRLLPWIAEQPFSPGYWSFSFGVAALPTLAMRLAASHGPELVVQIAPVAFASSNLIFAVLIVRTLALLAQGRLVPVLALPAAVAAK